MAATVAFADIGDFRNQFSRREQARRRSDLFRTRNQL